MARETISTEEFIDVILDTLAASDSLRERHMFRETLRALVRLGQAEQRHLDQANLLHRAPSLAHH